MFTKALVVVLCVFLAKEADANPVSVQTEKYLRQHLFEDYDKLVRPVTSSRHVVPVSVQITPLALRSVDFDSNILKLDTWLTVQWHDEYLHWDPTEFGGQENLILPASEVWKPDIAVYTATHDSASLPHVETNVLIHSNGDVLWVPPFTIENKCPTLNSHEIRQECDISMLSWTYDITQLDLNIGNATSLEYFIDDEPRWHLNSITPLRENKLFSCCKEFYPTIHFKVVLTDKNV
uniref:Acetylcholine-binding protein 5 n=1 Tax=Pardosa pseudoannulata TaxID=330961 RepID=A0A1Y0F4S4_9ARAC|nr:acetylcholine-binding protein 5 [Pardosa pseudoannulata]